MANIVEQAIARSIARNEIVTIEACDHEDVDALALESEDHVINGGVVEYWGADERGNEWRIHVRRDSVGW